MSGTGAVSRQGRRLADTRRAPAPVPVPRGGPARAHQADVSYLLRDAFDGQEAYAGGTAGSSAGVAVMTAAARGWRSRADGTAGKLMGRSGRSPSSSVPTHLTPHQNQRRTSVRTFPWPPLSRRVNAFPTRTLVYEAAGETRGASLRMLHAVDLGERSERARPPVKNPEDLRVRRPSQRAQESPRTPRDASSGTGRTPAASAPCSHRPGSTPGRAPGPPGRRRRTRCGGRRGPSGA